VEVLTVVGITILTYTGDEPLGVTAVLENLQLVPVGRVVFTHERLTCWLNPFDGVTIRV
jgi:hypothetical protein